MNAKVFGIRVSRLVALSMTFVVSAALVGLVGCGDGADQTTGTQAQPDPAAAKRQDDMTKFYEKNPLPKPGAKK